MRSQAITEFGKPLESIESPTPTPTGTEVLIRIEHCGVCHSDLHIHDGSFDLGGGAKLPMSGMKLPHTLGHEVAGEVIALGPDATGVAIGDHRAAYPWIGCGQCPACLRGEENYCGRPRNLGCSSGTPGGYATHVIVPHSRYLLDYGKTPPALAGTYMCSGLTAYGAMKKVGALGPKDEVLVLGAGGVGSMGIQFARHLFGKGPLVADIDEGRLQAAMGAGAKAAYNTKDPDSAKKLVADTEGGAYAIVDFVGSEATFAFANAAVRRGGRIIIVGLFGGGMSMPLPMFPMRALSIGGSYVGSLAETEEMMQLVRDGKIDPIPVQTRKLDAANDVLEDLRAGKVIGRVVLEP
ncbi:MAG TPA: alcohol dehydrogenase [Caulobacteraceae bacterium]|jgi:D-arabinose 1-dehydrogenase-like Zn-dependent alcohol dehydrogenase